MIRLSRGSRPWHQAELAVLDFETTGLDLGSDHVLSFGLVPIVEGRIRLAAAIYRLVKPPVELPAASITVHGIRPIDIVDAPALEEVADDLVDALADRELVAHAAWIELAFLNRFLRRRGLGRRRGAIDVLELARRLAALEGVLPGEVPSRLAPLAALHGVPVGRTHHAFGDALTTAQLFLVLATRLEERGLGKLRDLQPAPRGWWRRVTRRP